MTIQQYMKTAGQAYLEMNQGICPAELLKEALFMSREFFTSIFFGKPVEEFLRRLVVLCCVNKAVVLDYFQHCGGGIAVYRLVCELHLVCFVIGKTFCVKKTVL